MTIESINNKIPISARTTQKTGTAAKSSASSISSDKIDTHVADKIKSALALSTATPAVNSERIAGIRQAISNGAYTVNAERVASKILKFEQNLPEGET